MNIGAKLTVALLPVCLLSACATALLAPDERKQVCAVRVDDKFGSPVFHANPLSNPAGAVVGAGAGALAGIGPGMIIRRPDRRCRGSSVRRGLRRREPRLPECRRGFPGDPAFRRCGQPETRAGAGAQCAARWLRAASGGRCRSNGARHHRRDPQCRRNHGLPVWPAGVLGHRQVGRDDGAGPEGARRADDEVQPKVVPTGRRMVRQTGRSEGRGGARYGKDRRADGGRVALVGRVCPSANSEFGAPARGSRGGWTAAGLELSAPHGC